MTLILFLLSHSVYSQESNWLDGFFITASGQYYLLPDFAGISSMDLASRYASSASLNPKPGFRIGAGYELKNWSFALETGYSYISGDNPLVLEIKMIPVLLKMGYSFYPFNSLSQLSITPTAALGVVFVNAQHHKDIIDMLLGNLTYSKDTIFLLQPGVRAIWDIFPSRNRILEAFAGFSLDINLETDGIIPLPQIELGLIFRPFGRWKSQPKIESIQEIIFVTEEREIEKEDDVIIEIELIHSRRVFHVLFSPDQTIPTLEGLNNLDNAGALLEQFVNYTITLRGFAAPFVSTAGQMEVSRQRALFCANYLSEVFNVPNENIAIEWLGSAALPENTESVNHSRRRSVEIIIEGWINP
ncbi:MAG: hypothetical protein FWD47_11890 [Treponema sp.]|nr:hypothetical protein [Treponema sp.]